MDLRSYSNYMIDSSGVSLPVAKEIQTDRAIYIKEDIRKEYSLVCPFCEQPVIAKKGQIRRHHFAHKSDHNCNPSPESLLHLGAKHYLLYMLNLGIDFDIVIPAELIKADAPRAFLEHFQTDQLVIGANMVLGQKEYRHDLEKSVTKGIRPDVISKHHFFDSEVQNDTIGWEVFVTHEITPSKADLYNEAGVKFIEVIPEVLGFDEYRFTLKNHNLLNISSPNSELIKCLPSDTVRQLLNELQSHPVFPEFAKKSIETIFSETLDEIDPYTLIRRIGISGSNDEIDLSKDKHTHFSFSNSPEFRNQHKRKIDFQKISYSNKEKRIRINDEFLLPSDDFALAYFLLEMEKKGFGYSLRNDKVSGFHLSYLNSITLKTEKLEVRVDGTGNLSKASILKLSHARNSSGEPFPLVVTGSESLTIKNPRTILIKLFEQLSRSHKIELILQRSSTGVDQVTGMKVMNMISISPISAAFIKKNGLQLFEDKLTTS